MNITNTNYSMKLSRRTLLAGAGAGASLFSPPAKAAMVNNVAVGKDGWLFPGWDDIRATNPAHIKKVLETINKTVGIFQKAKIAVAISITPPKARIYPEALPDDFQMAAAVQGRWKTAIDGLRAPGTVVTDIVAVMNDLKRTFTAPEDTVFWKADTHWTAMGAEACAIALAKDIKAKINLPASAKRGTQLGPVRTLRFESRDLADRLPEAMRKNYPFQNYRIRPPVVAGASAALTEDDAADVVVIGNSNMDPRFGFAAAFSNQMDRPVNLVWKVDRVGPYGTLLAYLNGDSFKKQRPKLILWNFREPLMEVPVYWRDAWGEAAMPTDKFLETVTKAVS